MNKWQLARYIIDAKKCIDSLIYINDNYHQVRNLDLYDIIESKKRHFYLNLCILIDHCFKSKELKKIKEGNNIIEDIYYERDKNYAHKDEDYNILYDVSLKIIIDKLKKELSCCFDLCKESIPSVLTIDYISYDRNLFRFVNQISPDLEDSLEKLFYNNTYENLNEKCLVFDDTELLKYVNNPDDYAVLLKRGLIAKESLQNRQDFCIKINALHNFNIWCRVEKKFESIFREEEKALVDFLSKFKEINTGNIKE